MTTTFGPIRSRTPYCRCVCKVTYGDGYGSVEWETYGKDRAHLLVAEQVGRIKERGGTIESATVTTARGSTYDVLALLRED